MEMTLFEKKRTDKTESLDEALELASAKFASRVYPLNPTQVQVQQDGTLKLGGDLGKVKTTQDGIRGLCRVLRIPDPFANRIPFDLLQMNCERLLQGLDSLRAILRFDEDTVIGFIRGTKGTVSNEGILNATLRAMLGEHYSSPKITFTDTKMIATVTTEVELEPAVGDITRVGQILGNSQTGLFYPNSQLYTFRLSCLNGAVAPKSLGQVRIRVQAGEDEETTLSGFTKKVERLSMQEATLSMRYLRMSQTRCPEKVWYSSWTGVNRTIRDKDEADLVFGCSSDFRNRVKGFVKTEAGDPAKEQAPIIENTFYDVFNQISYGANTIDDIDQKHKLWVIAGKLIGSVNMAN